VPIFLERFVLPLLAGLVATVVLANVIQLDWPERIGIFAAVVVAAYLIARFLHRHN
jgi:membrane protein implicated in regulation of membrane protease activity